MDPGILSDRTQTVVIDNEKSATVPVTSGVPQGSVLGPILFLININDLPDKTKSKVRLFADDTAIYLAVSNLEDAQILQQDFHLWELDWDMEFNPSKCVVIHITRSRTQSQASTCCMVKYWNRLQAPSTWAWKSAATYPSTATFRI